jgi:hypothetical protein
MARPLGLLLLEVPTRFAEVEPLPSEFRRQVDSRFGLRQASGR